MRMHNFHVHAVAFIWNELDKMLGSLAVTCRTDDREVAGLTSGRSTAR